MPSLVGSALVSEGWITTFLSRLIGYTGVCLASPLAWLGAILLLIPVYYRRMRFLTRGA